MPKKSNVVVVRRSAIDGRFVSKAKVRRDPSHTVTEHRTGHKRVTKRSSKRG